MTSNQVLNALRAQPFKPFRLHLADGRAIAVGHPECVALNPGGRTTVVVQPDDAWNVVDLLLVTDIEYRDSFDPPEKRSA